MELEKRATEIIQEIIYVNIASVTPDGMPWNTPVYSAFDKNFNIYWASWKENQHSINIRSNKNVFITIYNSTAPEGTGEGVYLQGIAEELTSIPKMLPGLKVLYGRKDKKAKAAKLFLTSYPRRIYRFTPQKAWMNGEDRIKGNFVDKRDELDLNLVKTYLNNGN